MKKTLFACGVLAGLLFLLSIPPGCYYDNEEELYPGTNCDTANMRYSIEITQILQNNCYECHLPSSSTYSGISFETYNDFKIVALNGKLLNRINNAGNPMPQSGLMLLCNRQKIEARVNAGALNN